jgi:hypothetical protein
VRVWLGGRSDEERYLSYLEDPRFPAQVKEWLQLRLNEVNTKRERERERGREPHTRRGTHVFIHR